jgi:hypothetical protein
VRTIPRYKVILLAVPAAFTTSLLGWMAVGLEAIPIGTASEFWNRVCGVGLQEQRKFSRGGGVYPVYGERAFYFDQHHHGQDLYAVPLLALEAELPALKQRLADLSRNAPSEANAQRCRDGLGQLSEAPAASEVAALAADLADAAAALPKDQLPDFHSWIDALGRAKLALAFEAAFLLGWLLFAAWPWLFGQSPLRYAAHWAAAPTLLFLPYFLGYATLLFSSGPPGGYLYPLYASLWALPISFIPCAAVDVWLLESLPHPLTALSQLPGPPMALGIYGCVGPVGTLAFGAVLAAPFVLFARWRRNTPPTPSTS